MEEEVKKEERKIEVRLFIHSSFLCFSLMRLLVEQELDISGCSTHTVSFEQTV